MMMTSRAWLFLLGGVGLLVVSLSLGESDTASRKRYQRVEILKIAEPCPLIDPSQVVVTQGEILVADPVLTPIGMFIDSCDRLCYRR